MFWLLFSIFLGACVAAGAMGAIFPPVEWYEQLEKPGWTPPNWLFAPAWSILYAVMAYSGYLFTHTAEPHSRRSTM